WSSSRSPSIWCSWPRWSRSSPPTSAGGPRPGATRRTPSELARHRLVEVDVPRVEELGGGGPRGVPADEQREVLGHLAALDGLHAHVLEGGGEPADLGGAVEAGPEV